MDTWFDNVGNAVGLVAWEIPSQMLGAGIAITAKELPQAMTPLATGFLSAVGRAWGYLGLALTVNDFRNANKQVKKAKKEMQAKGMLDDYLFLATRNVYFAYTDGVCLV